MAPRLEILDVGVTTRAHPAPLLVLGAEHDGCISIQAVRALARAVGTDAEIFSGMGHNMMLEPGWDAVAERIHVWLGERDL